MYKFHCNSKGYNGKRPNRSANPKQQQNAKKREEEKKATVAEERLRSTLRGPKLSRADFFNTLTVDARVNLQSYLRHFSLLIKGNMASEILELISSLENVEIDKMPQFTTTAAKELSNIEYLLTSNNGSIAPLREVFKKVLPVAQLQAIQKHSVAFLDPMVRKQITPGSTRSIAVFSYDNDVSHSSAFMRYSPSMATVVAALPRMLSRRKAFLANRVTVDHNAMEQRDNREKKTLERRAAVFKSEDWYKDYVKSLGPKTEKVLLRVRVAKGVKHKQIHAAARALAAAEGAGQTEVAKALEMLNRCVPAEVGQQHMLEQNKEDADMAYDPDAVLDTADLARVVDLTDDIGGAREEVDITPGSLCWLSAMPSTSIPVIPRHVLAEMGVGNVGHNIVQAALAMNGHKIALSDVSNYEGLSARPYLVNHLWTEMSNYYTTLEEDANAGINKSLLSACGRVDNLMNIPIPSPLCPLEGLVLEVDRGTALVEVKMPVELADQWFPKQKSKKTLCKPLSLPKSKNIAQVIGLAKHHIMTQTGWPLTSPADANWLLVAGPQLLMSQRTLTALRTIATEQFTGSDAVRHAICRMEGLPLLDPHAPVRALKRVLGLNSSGYHVPGQGCEEVLKHLQQHAQGNALLAAIGAPTAEDYVVEHKYQVNGTEAQWKRLRTLVMNPRVLEPIAAQLHADEVGGFARLSSLIEPSARLERTATEVRMDQILCMRLRKLEFQKESYMPTDDVSQTKAEDVEEAVALSKAGRFYFRRMITNQSNNVQVNALTPYTLHSASSCAFNTRITNALLTKHIRMSSFTYQTEIDKLVRDYKAAIAGPDAQRLKISENAFPTEEQRLMHPQANHNPLSHGELELAKRILDQLPQLNPSQRRAIMLALNQSLTLIQGPPGTGKTSTITTLVWLWVCAMGAPLLIRDRHLPNPADYIASLPPDAAPSAELYDAADFAPSPFAEVEELVSRTLTCSKTIQTAVTPTPTPPGREQTDLSRSILSFFKRTPTTVDLRTEPVQPPPAPKSSAELLQPLNVSGRGPVLVSAFTNVAIDEICARLLEMPGFKWQDKSRPLYTIVRIGNSKKIDPRVEKARMSWHLDHDEEYQKEFRKYSLLIAALDKSMRAAEAMEAYLNSVMGLVKQTAAQQVARRRALAATGISSPQRNASVEEEKVVVNHPPRVRELMLAMNLEPIKPQLSQKDIVILKSIIIDNHDKNRKTRKRFNGDLNAARMRAEDRIMAAASVVIGTCMGVGSKILENSRFSLVVVDECSQVPEPACLVPISRLAPCMPTDFTGEISTHSALWQKVVDDKGYHAPEKLAKLGFAPSVRSPGSFSRVVLVGDQCQLPPVVDSELMKLAGVHISLFERLMNSAPHASTSLFFGEPLFTNDPKRYVTQQPRLAPRTALLHTQYRMNPVLASWISSKVYSNRITSGTHAGHRKCPPGFPWPIAIECSETSAKNIKALAFGEAASEADPLTRGVLSQYLAFEGFVHSLVPNVSPERFAMDLFTAAKADKVSPLVQNKVPHKSLQAATQGDKKELKHLFFECWCHDNASSPHVHAHKLSLLQELANYIAKRMHRDSYGTLRGTRVRYATGSGAALVRQYPIVFIDVPHHENGDGMDSSKSNTHEAQLAAHIAASLIGALPSMEKLLHKHLEKTVQDVAHKLNEKLPSVPEGSIESLVLNMSSLTLKTDDHEAPKECDDIVGVDELSLNQIVSRTWLAEAVARAQGPPVRASEVGIVTPYVGQVREVLNALADVKTVCLKNKWRDHDISKIEVKSVDGFQGREKEVIIMTCVRSNAYKSIGFLADLRRLNVAVSRAKRGLIMIGNRETLRTHPLWASYIEAVEKCGAIVPYDSIAPWLMAGVALPDFIGA